ncbi:response regulator transcription factor [Kiloniella sp. EL199]|uniref:response regulator transcription factor n=1 Tax=Kiloniella sp. EL199 TaxID=2107581 RepID=UPI001C1F8697|nr:response regulator transcription factor [Kiloniella sp. EL199]
MPNVGKVDIEPIKVALADSNPLMLSALSEFFDRDSRFSLVASVGSAENFLEITLLSTFTVGIVDWSLPMLGGERLIEIIRNQEKPPRIVVYAQGDHQDIPKQAMAAGAAGYCSRSQPPEYLLDIVEDIAKGGMVFPFVDVRDLRQDPMRSLTKRERTLLVSLAQGRTNKELARDHDISLNTVKFHLRNLFDKLSVTNRSQAIAYYYSTRVSLQNEQEE